MFDFCIRKIRLIIERIKLSEVESMVCSTLKMKNVTDCALLDIRKVYLPQQKKNSIKLSPTL